VGEIGGNDYNFAAFEGKSMEELYDLVPEVVQTIVYVVKVSSPFLKFEMIYSP